LSEAVVDSKGRVLIPEKIRKKVGIVAGTKLRISTQDRVVILTMSKDPSEFIHETEGVIKGDSRVKASDPLKLKEIWTTRR